MSKRLKLALLVTLLAVPSAVILWRSHVARSSHAQSTSNMPPLPTMNGVSGSIGGSLLLAGGCSSGTVTVTGAQVGSPAIATPSDGTNIPGVGVDVSAVVTSTGTVTVNVCALLSVTPASKTYNVRVIQ